MEFERILIDSQVRTHCCTESVFLVFIDHLAYWCHALRLLNDMVICTLVLNGLVLMQPRET